MNTFSKFKISFLFAAFILITSCVQDDDYSIPPIICTNDTTPTTTLAEFKAMNDTAEPLEITEPTIFEGYVISTDETGGFFKTISIQNAIENPTQGMQVELDMTDTHTQFPLGSKIFVNAQGLHLAKDFGVHKLGETYDDDGDLRVGRMAENAVFDHLSKSCDALVDIVPTSFTNIENALSVENLNTLIKLEGVQFQTVGEGVTFYDEDNAVGGATNRVIQDAAGNTIALRTSSFASFKNDELPTGSGNITIVLSAYDVNGSLTDSDYQAYIRFVTDVEFTEERFTVSNGEGPIGGGSASYQNCVNEDFESYGTGVTSFNNYINDAFNGGRYWEVREFDDNKYIQLSSFNSDETNEVYLIVPVNFSEADTFSFETNDGYNNGDALTVHYTTNYTIGETLDINSLTDITSDFTISTGNTNGYGSSFTASGDYDLSAISGNGAIVFKYAGAADGVTTTMQIDDIMVVDNDANDCGEGSNPGDTAAIPFTETFDNGISAWTTFNVTGSRSWEGRNYEDEFYAQNSAYSSGNILDVESWLISPAFDFDAQTGESAVLNIADAFSNGNPLKMYYSTDYASSGNPSSATWTEIGASQIDALQDNTATYDNVYEATAAIDLSMISGTGYIAFVYDSEDATVSTTIQISNVAITAN